MVQISVIMSAYNSQEYITEAVSSILNQSFRDFEFIIIDDASNDNTQKLIRCFSDQRIKFIRNNTNKGLTRNLISGWRLANGKYIARMDADDISMLNRFEEQVAYLEANPNISILGSAVTFFDSEGYQFTAYQPESHDEIKVALFLGFTMLHPSIMMRKSDLDNHGLNYNPIFRVSQDHDLWTRAIRKVNFANLPISLLKMREHSGKIGRNYKNKQEEFSSLIRIRQLKELGIEIQNKELEAFNLASGNKEQFKGNQILALESIFLKIIKANKVEKVYNQDVLERKTAALFRTICRALLLEKDNYGYCYWNSPMRKYDKMTIKEKVGLYYRFLNSFF